MVHDVSHSIEHTLAGFARLIRPPIYDETGHLWDNVIPIHYYAKVLNVEENVARVKLLAAASIGLSRLQHVPGLGGCDDSVRLEGPKTVELVAESFLIASVRGVCLKLEYSRSEPAKRSRSVNRTRAVDAAKKMPRWDCDRQAQSCKSVLHAAGPAGAAPGSITS
jgi:hypothetical protein